MVNCHIPKREMPFTSVAVAFLFSIEGMLMCTIVRQFLTASGYIIALDNFAQETDFSL